MNLNVMVENTLAHYLVNLVSNCTQIFSTMTIWLCIKFANINALFLATFSGFCQNIEMENIRNLI